MYRKTIENYQFMGQKMKYYTAEEIAESLGVNVASVCRWADSGKLQSSDSEGGITKFSTENLSEFAAKYNISMKFLLEQKYRKYENKKIVRQISAVQ